eukprot:199756_1
MLWIACSILYVIAICIPRVGAPRIISDDIRCDGIVRGDTLNNENVFGSGSPDVVYRLSLMNATRIIISSCGSFEGNNMYILASEWLTTGYCPQPLCQCLSTGGDHCIDSSQLCPANSIMQCDLMAGEYVVVFEGSAPVRSGRYTLMMDCGECFRITGLQCSEGRVCKNNICVPMPENPDICGGFAGFMCPDGFQCVDDPRDECAPPLASDCL